MTQSKCQNFKCKYYKTRIYLEYKIPEIHEENLSSQYMYNVFSLSPVFL